MKDRGVRWALSLVLVGTLVSGCVKFSRPGEGAAKPAKDAAPESKLTPTERRFPKTLELIADAEQALSTDGARAVELAKEAREALDDEHASHDKRHADDYKRLGNSADVLRSMGHASVEPLDAMLYWGFRGFSTFRCDKLLSDLKEPCKQHGRDMLAALPQLLKSRNDGSIRFKSTVGGSSLAKASFLKSMDEKVREAKQTPLGGVFTPTSRKTVGDKVILSVDGETTRSSLTKCRDTGVKIKIGKSDFDLKRCHKQGFMSYAAHFRVELPASDVADLEPGDTVYVLFEPKDYRASGSTRTIKNARFAYREPEGARQW